MSQAKQEVNSIGLTSSPFVFWNHPLPSESNITDQLSMKKVACGLCLPCYRQHRLGEEYDPDLCILANLICPSSVSSETTSTSDHNSTLAKTVSVNVSRLTLRCEKEAQQGNRFGRAVFTSEIKVRCKVCHEVGWRPVSGTSYGSTVFYYNLEESDSIS